MKAYPRRPFWVGALADVFFRWRRRPATLLHQKSLLLAHLHDFQPVACADLLSYAVEMIFHRLFRKAEMVRNLFVRQSLRNQRNNLLFPPCETQVPLDHRGGESPRLPLKITKQRQAQLPGANRLSGK